MKTKYAFTITSLLIISLWLFAIPAWAEESEAVDMAELPPLYFYAVNAGYKDDLSAQNYDFFELRKTGEGDLSLEDYELVYTNSSGNALSPLGFANGLVLRGDALVFGFSKSPQYAESSADYLYNFGSSGLASTSGKLSLYYAGELQDEICWGKLECDKQIAKFVSTEEGNFSYVFEEGELKPEKYYPAIIEDAL